MTLSCIMLNAIVAVSVMSTLCAGEKRFKENGKWGQIITESYVATLMKNGQFEIDVKDTLTVNACFIQRWKYQQVFPKTMFMRAKIETNGADSIKIVYKYLWNEGTVKEVLSFDCRSICVAYSFLPWSKKDTRWLTCLLTMKTAEKRNAKLVGLDFKHLEGVLVNIGKWRWMRSYFRTVSITNVGSFVVDFISKDMAWINILKYPQLAVIKNAKQKIWDDTSYQKDEEYKIEYLIFISQSDGRSIEASPIRFVEKEFDH